MLCTFIQPFVLYTYTDFSDNKLLDNDECYEDNDDHSCYVTVKIMLHLDRSILWLCNCLHNGNPNENNSYNRH